MKIDNSSYDNDGNICAEDQHINLHKTEEWKYYLVIGILKAIGKFENIIMEGEWKWYRESSNLIQIGSFDNEKKIGI